MCILSLYFAEFYLHTLPNLLYFVILLAAAINQICLFGLALKLAIRNNDWRKGEKWSFLLAIDLCQENNIVYAYVIPLTTTRLERQRRRYFSEN